MSRKIKRPPTQSQAPRTILMVSAAIIGAALLGVGVLAYAANLASSGATKPDPAYVWGRADAPITVEVYSDFQ